MANESGLRVKSVWMTLLKCVGTVDFEPSDPLVHNQNALPYRLRLSSNHLNWLEAVSLPNSTGALLTSSPVFQAPALEPRLALSRDIDKLSFFSQKPHTLYLCAPGDIEPRTRRTCPRVLSLFAVLPIFIHSSAYE